MKFSSVVSYHTNVNGCGVAKFGKHLADRLGVPFCDFDAEWGMAPLFSLKWSELTPDDREKWREAITFVQYLGSDVSVFWHDKGDDAVTSCSEHVFYADASLGSPALWCPSLLKPRPRMIRLFSFGMAGRVQANRFNKVHRLLTDSGLRYTVRVSVGLHEGTSIDDAERHFDMLRDVMRQESVTILGCLSDDAVADELANADYVLAFFEKGVRANNTTVHAALDAGCRVITNHDEQTPAPMRMSTMDIHHLTSWPAFNKTAMAAYSWENLITEMSKLCEASRSTAAK